ncbi:MAG: galactose mutarotase [Lachnospiraceae bacterium]|nr:galactose mutarotase [Lachnospiraceae bacterium]
MHIKKEIFTKDRNGTETAYYEMKNENGMTVKVCEIGAAIIEISVPDRNGNLDDVVLGYDKPEYYFENWPAFGAVVGRCANRIDRSVFSLNGKKYMLEKSRAGYTLHSGSQGYQYRVWESAAYEDEEGFNVKFTLFSPDGDQGFPGNLKVDVIYTLSSDNALTLTYDCVSDSDTVLNLTNHCYFNLQKQDAGSVFQHYVQINSDRVCRVDRRLIPDGSMADVRDTSFDFRKRKKIGDGLNRPFQPVTPFNEYDINYKINDSFGIQKQAAVLECEENGRGMRVYTDMPGMQFYTAGALGEKNKGKNGVTYEKYGAVCFETQFFPNAIHIPEFVQPVLLKGKRFVSKTKYEFYIF